MPQIFTGKVVIPGEPLPQYLEARAETGAARAVLDALPDAVLLASGDGRCLWGNAALAVLLGHQPEELRRYSVAGLLGMGAGGWHEGWSGEAEARHHDGRTVPVEARFSAVSVA